MKSIVIGSSLNQIPENDIRSPIWSLSPHLISRLSDLEISHLFPVQAAILPLMLCTRYSSAPKSPGDLCVSAPTGSGKTLAYALPMVDFLIHRVIPRIRALIVLPTRDLAIQVKTTFDHLLKGTSIRLLVLTGQSSLAHEQRVLMTDLAGELCDQPQVDIIIATAGRLQEHLFQTHGFSLAHLRFLVVDEADRLLSQSYQDWLPRVLESAKGGQQSHSMEIEYDSIGLPIRQDAFTLRQHAAGSDQLTSTTPLQKLLFSATLTQDPSQLAPLQLHNPTVICVQGHSQESDESTKPVHGEDHGWSLPPTLTEHLLVTVSTADKPSTLLALLSTLPTTGTLIFTKSVQSAHRLSFLINTFSSSLYPPHESHPPASVSLTSDLTASTRASLITQFKNGQISALVCSDVLARGIDLGQCVSTVINYDIPTSLETYIHRVGRTARAGNPGEAISLLEEHQVKWFKKLMLQVKRSEQMKKKKVEVGQGVQERYREALMKLEQLVKDRKGTKTNQEEEESSDSSDSDLESSASSEDGSDSDMDTVSMDEDAPETEMMEKKETVPLETSEKTWWSSGWI